MTPTNAKPKPRLRYILGCWHYYLAPHAKRPVIIGSDIKIISKRVTSTPNRFGFLPK
jgi:hypothetical protein